MKTTLKRREFLQTMGTGAAALTMSPLVGCGRKPPRQPNIIIILSDDLGYGDVGCYNPESKIPTPNLNKLAREGILFTDAHSPATVCTPSRYSLLTGRMAFRTGKGSAVFEGPGGPSLIEDWRLTLGGDAPEVRLHHGRLRKMARRPDLAGQQRRADHGSTGGRRPEDRL